ncbi:beta subunit of N-acylethanolamine-hydrolyzing acid amidase-domain-containing protein [Coniochaeta sp. 2T2.1]|nr:beta subunit of N-acylethanolamine-hydrolyzing acid amidase-domain-containing protein [Coniochaeta sp. 2T2.1]
MDSAGLRTRARSSGGNSDQTSETGTSTVFQSSPANSREIPSFTVDLSAKPGHRYDHISTQLLPHIKRAKLTHMFDDLIDSILPGLVGNMAKRFAPMLLRRVYSDEENAELVGIARDTQLPMYLLVAFNVLLDMLMGCTSGGVKVEEKDEKGVWRSRMVHFRTLDWGMDPLREIVVELNYVRSPKGPVVATTVGYFGYVGVLTGVRKGLSMSLNFRPRHDDSTLKKRISFRHHQLMVVLGLRPSISSVLRRYLLNEPQSCPSHKSKGQTDLTAKDVSFPETERKKKEKPSNPTAFNIHTIMTELSTCPSTSAYLIFCTPQSIFILEKDNNKCFARTSDGFLTAYNHDAVDEKDPLALAETARQLSAQKRAATTGMEEIVEFSCDRKRVLDRIHDRCVKRHRKRFGRHDNGDAVGMEDVLKFLNDRDRWIVNEETHYAVVMDPKSGDVVWRRAYEVVRESDSDVEEPGA